MPVMIFYGCLSLDKVAFHASLSYDKSIRGATSGQTVIFNRVDTNLGGGYNGTTGVFRAPVAGTYVFSLTFFMSYHTTDPSRGELHIVKNNGYGLRVFRELDTNIDEGTATGTTVLPLNKGDQVHVIAATANMFIVGNDLSYFSGFMLG